LLLCVNETVPEREVETEKPLRVVCLVVTLAATEASYLKDAPGLHEVLKMFTCFEPKTEKAPQ
jgi:hypothetical protein